MVSSLSRILIGCGSGWHQEVLPSVWFERLRLENIAKNTIVKSFTNVEIYILKNKMEPAT